jgi:hypothetical protein
MEDKKVDELVAKLEKYKEELAKSAEKSKKFLVDVGIITAKGNLAKNYKH